MSLPFVHLRRRQMMSALTTRDRPHQHGEAALSLGRGEKKRWKGGLTKKIPDWGHRTCEAKPTGGETHGTQV